MLRNLYVKNLALISSLSVDFSAGFSVLTGETGAGKSLVLDSLNLFLQKGSPKELIRRGEEEMAVSLYFDSLSDAALAKIADLVPGAETEDGLSLTRKIERSGKSACRINGRSVPFATLREAALSLFFIHGQHDVAGLLDAKTHIGFLDSAFSAAELAAKAEYRALFADYKKISAEIDRMLKDTRDPEAAAAYYDYQIREITKAHVKENEEEILSKKLAELRASEKIHAALSLCDRALSGGEKGRGAAALLEIAAAKMETLADFEAYTELAKTLRTLALEVQSAAEEAAALRADFAEEDPGEQMDKIQRRLDTLYRLKAKYGNTEEEILAFLQKVTAEKEELLTRSDRLADLESERAALRETLRQRAAVLTRIREAKKTKLESEVQKVLAFLDMEKTRFEVHITPLPEFSGEGLDEVEFFVATNPGEDAKPLCRIASGGELSRIMLALQCKLGREKDIGTLIFDEIDTGISGSTSQKIGISLKSLAEKGQIFCVTHSAQVASLADRHYRVSKSEENGRTETRVSLLSENESLSEIARILGGKEIGAESRSNAAALRAEGLSEFEKQKKLLS